MTLPYAFFTDGRASGIPIALWACKPKPGTLTKKFELRFAPIEGAYVACVQVSADRASVPIRPEFIRYGRTNRVGWVVRREREALGAETEIPEAREPLVDPRPDWFLRTDPVLFDIPEQKADRTLLYGLPNERYRIFWSYNRDLFDLFAGELEADPERALGAYGVSEYVMEPFGRPTPAGSLDFMDEYDHGAIPRVLFPGERRGYHAGWYFKEMFTPAIFDATPESFRALYGSEWLQWCCERIVHDDPDWPYLWSLASVIRAAEIGAPIPDLAKDLPAGGEMAKRAAEMRAYVYQCAKHGVRERDSILDALTIGSETSATRPFGGGWRNAADAIAEATGMNHPALAHQQYLDQFYFPERTKAALVAYFDMYALGFDRQQDALPIAAHAVHIREALDWVHEKQKRLLASFRHDQFMRDLALHVPAPDFAVRVELADRYHFQCANAQLPFWESADAKLSTQEDWDRLAPYLSALGEGADLLSELFEGLLNRYITAYRLQAESVETMVRYLYRYDRTLSRQRAEQSLPRCSATLNLEHDEVTGRAVVKLYRGARTTLLGEYEFLTKVVATSAGEAHAPLGVTDTQQRLLMYRRAMRRKQVREFVLAKQTLEVPHAELLSGFPKLLANTGALIKSGLAIHALVAQAKEKAYADIEPDVYLEVAEESFQAFEPITDVAQSVLVKAGMSAESAAANPFVRGGATLAKLGTVIEATRNLIAGTQTLATLIAPTRSNTDLANYWARGEVVPVWLEGVKGLVQVASGGAGFGTLVLGASTTVATLPLSAWVAVGLVVVATLNVLIYQETGGGSPVDGYLRSVREARKRQFKLSTNDQILRPGDPIVLGEVDPDSGGVDTTNCRMARQLGVVNETAKYARLGESATPTSSNQRGS